MKNLLLIMTMVVCAGCTSIWSLQCSKDEILRDRVLESGNQRGVRILQAGGSEDTAIRAMALQDGVGIGLDVSNLQALSQHPWRQLGAAVLDAGMTYGTYLGGKALMNAGNSDNTPNQTAGRDIIIVNGRGNNVGDRTSIVKTTTTAE